MFISSKVKKYDVLEAINGILADEHAGRKELGPSDMGWLALLLTAWIAQF